MSEAHDWRTVYDFWFAPGLDDGDATAHRQRFAWWMGGGANAELPQFSRVLAAAKAGHLDHWSATPLGRLALILVLDQFPRGLFAATAESYACDPAALAVTQEGLRTGHYAALSRPWEKTFFFMPLAHAEGPDHRARLERVVKMAEALIQEVPERLRPVYQFSAGQARGHLEVIARFGRFPHRNAVLGRASTAEEAKYLQKGDFVHTRGPAELRA